MNACSLCGEVGYTEEHHPARRRYAADLTVRVCQPCHDDYLTRMHLAAGIQDGNWRRDAATERDPASATVLGVLHVLRLLAHFVGDNERRNVLAAVEPALALVLARLRPDAPIGSPRWSLLPEYPDRTGSRELPEAALADLLAMVGELARILDVAVAIPDNPGSLPHLASDLVAGDALTARFAELFAPHQPEPPIGQVERLALDWAEWVASVRGRLAE